MFSGAKPNIKKRTTRAIANVISWLRLGNLSAPTAIIKSPKSDSAAEKKRCNSAVFSATESHHLLTITILSVYHIMSNLFFRSLFLGVTLPGYPAARYRNVFFVRPVMGLFALAPRTMTCLRVFGAKFFTTPMTLLFVIPISHRYSLCIQGLSYPVFA